MKPNSFRSFIMLVIVILMTACAQSEEDKIKHEISALETRMKNQISNIRKQADQQIKTANQSAQTEINRINDEAQQKIKQVRSELQNQTEQISSDSYKQAENLLAETRSKLDELQNRARERITGPDTNVVQQTIQGIEAEAKEALHTIQQASRDAFKNMTGQGGQVQGATTLKRGHEKP